MSGLVHCEFSNLSERQKKVVIASSESDGAISKDCFNIFENILLRFYPPVPYIPFTL